MNYRAVPGRVRVLALAALLVLAVLGAPGAVGGEAVDSDVGARAVGPLGVAIADSDNETTRHRNPSEYSEGGDREGLAVALERQLRRQLGQGAIELSEGQYDGASDYVGESFEQQLSEYVDVADETGDEETAEELRSAKEDLENLSTTRRQYEETREEYEAAREAGDDDRARALARELERLASGINASSASLADHSGAVEEGAGGDGGGSDAAASVGDEVAATQAEIRAESFEETRLSVATDSGTASYSDPLSATGSLATADGEPIGGETIRLDVGNQSLSVETAADGSFAFSYRPISVPVSADSVSVAYVPENASAYLGSAATMSVSIDQETPAITEPGVVAIESGGDGATYGDTVTVSATVTVDGGPVANLPLAVRLGGEPLDIVETDGTGRLEGSVRVPASVPDGERELTVALPFEDRALAGASASTTMTVGATTPDLSVESSAAGDGEVTVNGTLAADGDGIANQSVAIAVDGEPLTTAPTDADGRFGTLVALPDSARGDVTVTASLSGAGTNLAPAEASATVATSQGPGNPAIGGVLVVVGLLVGAAGLTGWWLWRRRGAADESAPVADLPVEPGRGGASEPSRPAATVLLSQAQDAVGADRPEAAIRTAYGAVRRHLAGADRDARTHWEFYRERESAAGDPESLRALTEEYERATFDPAGVDGSTAERALSRARALCDVGDGGDERAGVSSGDD